MRSTSLTLLLVVLMASVAAVSVQAGNQKKSMKPTTIEGTLVDSKCYAMGQFKTDEHMNMKGDKMAGCGTACAAMGIPVAIVDGDNRVYVLAVPAAEYSKWMAMEIRVTGMMGAHADVLIPEKLEIKEDGEWVEKQLPGTMM